MANVKTYSRQATITCKSGTEYQAAKLALLATYCGTSKAQITLPNNVTSDFYTCPPFVDNAKFPNACPANYTQMGNTTLNDGGLVMKCMGIISDATAGEPIVGYQC